METSKITENNVIDGSATQTQTSSMEQCTQPEGIEERIQKIEDRLINLEEKFDLLERQAAGKEKVNKAFYLQNMKVQLMELLSSGEISFAHVGKTFVIGNSQPENFKSAQEPPVKQKVKRKDRRFEKKAAGRHVIVEPPKPGEIDQAIIASCLQPATLPAARFEKKAASTHFTIQAPKPGELEKATFAGPSPVATESFSNASIITSDDDRTPLKITPSIMMEEYRQFHCNMLAFKDSVETLRLNRQPTFQDD